ncbi:hypothetical protein Achl_0237 [Pseudarthrobacter chlorophenolicus A6]|uniref:Uncharacterized protein n=1 Tax=Pseudarthrobacter chlorophenolicus (strain ATCC 700700 / DSM 12829 / CIP 107037 / JCM 12360 / KCTC 9906 / NCIMB 13794 / A6) TaxID=452863 RepID=B8H979_PSECP|nr:hypothetical protein Achl_0237 [Pseudarthrobacter chlorophenolicus A6]SDQ52737.1 hypothetical protein SAMN04489738_1295 [Pseudarthrobacter chlorophenolicus]
MVSSLITQLGLLRPMERAAKVWQGERDTQQVAEMPRSTPWRLPGALRSDVSGGIARFRLSCLTGMSIHRHGRSPKSAMNRAAKGSHSLLGNPGLGGASAAPASLHRRHR